MRFGPRNQPTKCAIVTRADGSRVKRCSGCTEVKDVSAFSLGSGPGGFHRHCRACCKAWRQAAKLRKAA